MLDFREVRCIFSQHLKVSNVLDSLTVGTENLKERVLKLVVQEKIHKDSDWMSKDSMMVGIHAEGFCGVAAG